MKTETQLLEIQADLLKFLGFEDARDGETPAAVFHKTLPGVSGFVFDPECDELKDLIPNLCEQMIEAGKRQLRAELRGLLECPSRYDTPTIKED